MFPLKGGPSLWKVDLQEWGARTAAWPRTLAGCRKSSTLLAGFVSARTMRLMFSRVALSALVLTSTFVTATACKGGAEDDGTGGMGGTDPGTGGSGTDGDAGCGELTGSGTEVSGTIDGDETWTPEGSPYIVSGNVDVTGNLLLEACTVVELEQDAGFSVSGSLVARGGTEETDEGDQVFTPVAFVQRNAGEPWGSIDVAPEGMLDLEVTALAGGGSREATIHAYGEDQYGLPHRNVRVLSVGIVASVGYGVMLETRA